MYVLSLGSREEDTESATIRVAEYLWINYIYLQNWSYLILQSPESKKLLNASNQNRRLDRGLRIYRRPWQVIVLVRVR